MQIDDKFKQFKLFHLETINQTLKDLHENSKHSAIKIGPLVDMSPPQVFPKDFGGHTLQYCEKIKCSDPSLRVEA